MGGQALRRARRTCARSRAPARWRRWPRAWPAPVAGLPGPAAARRIDVAAARRLPRCGCPSGPAACSAAPSARPSRRCAGPRAACSSGSARAPRRRRPSRSCCGPHGLDLLPADIAIDNDARGMPWSPRPGSRRSRWCRWSRSRHAAGRAAALALARRPRRRRRVGLDVEPRAPAARPLRRRGAHARASARSWSPCRPPSTRSGCCAAGAPRRRPGKAMGAGLAHGDGHPRDRRRGDGATGTIRVRVAGRELTARTCRDGDLVAATVLRTDDGGTPMTQTRPGRPGPRPGHARRARGRLGVRRRGRAAHPLRRRPGPRVARHRRARHDAPAALRPPAATPSSSRRSGERPVEERDVTVLELVAFVCEHRQPDARRRRDMGPTLLIGLDGATFYGPRPANGARRDAVPGLADRARRAGRAALDHAAAHAAGVDVADDRQAPGRARRLRLLPEGGAGQRSLPLRELAGRPQRDDLVAGERRGRAGPLAELPADVPAARRRRLRRARRLDAVAPAPARLPSRPGCSTGSSALPGFEPREMLDMELEVKAIEGCPDDEYAGLGRSCTSRASSAGSRSRATSWSRSRPSWSASCSTASTSSSTSAGASSTRPAGPREPDRRGRPR